MTIQEERRGDEKREEKGEELGEEVTGKEDRRGEGIG